MFISVIIPVHNGAAHITRCLAALKASSHKDFETVVIDDRSTDLSASLAEAGGARVLRLARQTGPAGARNFGAEYARGEVLLFIDADVAVKPDTLSRVAASFADNTLAAVFGSYDATPAEMNFISQYKNLFHHFVHQQSDSAVETFWAGCGAIRTKVFKRVGGFDARSYPDPSVEDIELGYRLSAAGAHIRLDKDLQATHLKRWTFRSLLYADIFRRALPWSKLMLERGRLDRNLNLKLSQRLSGVLVLVALTVVLLNILALASHALLASFFPLLTLSPAAFHLSLLAAAASSVIAVLFINRNLYLFFRRTRGAWFMLRAVPMHLLYYLYSSLAFIYSRMTKMFRRQSGKSQTYVHAEN